MYIDTRDLNVFTLGKTKPVYKPSILEKLLSMQMCLGRAQQGSWNTDFHISRTLPPVSPPQHQWKGKVDCFQSESMPRHFCVIHHFPLIKLKFEEVYCYAET